MELREARESDGDALAALAAASADTGAIRYFPRYHGNPVVAAAALEPGLRWVLAEERGTLLGAAQISFGECELEGEVSPFALLNSLAVHRDHRRRGIARALTDWRLEQAGDAVVLANIQSGNEGSFANARRWATHFIGQLATPPFGMRGRAPRSPLAFRDAAGGDWDAAAAGLARFEAGWNLRVPESGGSLEEWASVEVFGGRMRRYLVAVDGGEVVAGAGFVEAARVTTLQIEHLPPAIRVLNLALRVVPRDRVLRQIGMNRFWWADGREAAGGALLEHARWTLRDVGNAILVTLDLRGPLREVLPLKPWTPKAVGSVAIRSAVAVDESTLLAPLLGG
jgi:GNAT superfamily N-acetyltransferase